ncbi:MAG: CE1 family esterase [Dehalococcoidia bacterium]
MRRTIPFWTCAAALLAAACGGITANAGRTASLAPGTVTPPPVTAPPSTPTVPAPDPSATPAPPPAASPAAAACSPARPHAAGTFSESIQSGGLTRTYIVHIPPSYAGARPMPLVLVFHGSGLDGAYMVRYSNFDPLADAAGVIMVYPDAVAPAREWNTWKSPEDPDDERFVGDLLTTLDRQLCVDPARVYAAGYSNGGGMAQRLACDMSGRIAAVGLVGAAYFTCPERTPVIAFNGTADTFVPFGGSPEADPGHGPAPPVNDVLAGWARNIGCSPVPKVSRLTSDVELSVFQGCPRGDGEVQLYTIVGGGHTWPGGAFADARLGKTTADLSASLAMLGFFDAYPKP